MNVRFAHISPYVRALEARQRTSNRNRDCSQRHPQNLCDFTIAETFGTQVKAALVLLGQGPQNGEQTILPLAAGHSLLRIWAGIHVPLGSACF